MPENGAQDGLPAARPQQPMPWSIPCYAAADDTVYWPGYAARVYLLPWGMRGEDLEVPSAWTSDLLWRWNWLAWFTGAYPDLAPHSPYPSVHPDWFDPWSIQPHQGYWMV